LGRGWLLWDSGGGGGGGSPSLFNSTLCAAGIAIIVAITVAHACARYSQDKVNGVRWVLLMLAAGGVVTIYFIIIPRC